MNPTMQSINQSINEPMSSRLLGRHPNTYTFTKQLAEHLLAAEREHVKLAIVRPSIGEDTSIF